MMTLPVCDSDKSPLVKTPILSLGLVQPREATDPLRGGHVDESNGSPVLALKGLKAAKALAILQQQIMQQRDRAWNKSVASFQIQRREKTTTLLALKVSPRLESTSPSTIQLRGLGR